MEDGGQLVIAVVAAIPDLQIEVDLARHPHGYRPGGNPLGGGASVAAWHGTTLSECSRPATAFDGYVVDGVLGPADTPRCTGRITPPDLNRVVALKVLDDEHRHQAQVARLRREFEFAHRLHHPHIVTVYERGPGGCRWNWSPAAGIADIDTIANRLAALAQIADALDYTHNHAIVHCDVKPANILVRQE